MIATGLIWAEGPLWVDQDGGYLLFTDVPGNKIYKWTEKNGAEIFLDQAGGPDRDPDVFREPGANGLSLSGNPETIIVANHGYRAVMELNLATKQLQDLASRYAGKRFNSPNDVARSSNGAIYFTDPPYGLKGLGASPHKEQIVNGVYRRGPDGAVELLIDDLTFPNGIALSPDETSLYVAVSDPENPVIMAYALSAEGEVGAPRRFFDASGDNSAKPGLPDGMVVDARGNIFATAPGGVHIFQPDGHWLGVIHTGSANANCTIGENGKTLFIAAHDKILRVSLADGAQH